MRKIARHGVTVRTTTETGLITPEQAEVDAAALNRIARDLGRPQRHSAEAIRAEHDAKANALIFWGAETARTTIRTASARPSVRKAFR